MDKLGRTDERIQSSLLYSSFLRNSNVNPSEMEQQVQVEKTGVVLWINQQLAKAGYADQLVTDLSADMADGITFLRLVQALSNEPLPRHDPNPMMRVQKIENYQVCLDLLRQKGLQLVGVHAEDIASGSLKTILGLCHSLKLHFSSDNPRRVVRRTTSMTSGAHPYYLHHHHKDHKLLPHSNPSPGASPSRALSNNPPLPSPPHPHPSLHPPSLLHPPSHHYLSTAALERDDMVVLSWLEGIVRMNLQDYSMLHDGKLLCELVNAVFGGVVSVEDIASNPPIERLRMAFAAASKELQLSQDSFNPTAVALGQGDKMLRNFLQQCRIAHQRRTDLHPLGKHRESHKEATVSERVGAGGIGGSGLPPYNRGEGALALDNGLKANVGWKMERREEAKVAMKSYDAIQCRRVAGDSSPRPEGGTRRDAKLPLGEKTKTSENGESSAAKTENESSRETAMTTSFRHHNRSSSAGNLLSMRVNTGDSLPPSLPQDQPDQPTAAPAVSLKPPGRSGKRRPHSSLFAIGGGSSESFGDLLAKEEEQQLHQKQLMQSHPLVKYKSTGVLGTSATGNSITGNGNGSLLGHSHLTSHMHGQYKSMESGITANGAAKRRPDSFFLSSSASQAELTAEAAAAAAAATSREGGGGGGGGGGRPVSRQSSTSSMTKPSSLLLNRGLARSTDLAGSKMTTSTTSLASSVASSYTAPRRSLSYSRLDSSAGLDEVNSQVTKLQERVAMLAVVFDSESKSVVKQLQRSLAKERKKREEVEKRLKAVEEGARTLINHYDSCILQLAQEVSTLKAELQMCVGEGPTVSFVESELSKLKDQIQSLSEGKAVGRMMPEDLGTASSSREHESCDHDDSDGRAAAAAAAPSPSKHHQTPVHLTQPPIASKKERSTEKDKSLKGTVVFLRKKPQSSPTSRGGFTGPYLRGPTWRFKKLCSFFGEEPPWVEESLQTFLQRLGYEHLLERFDSHSITLAELYSMREEDLERLNVPLGPRLRIMSEVKELYPVHPLDY